MGFAQGCVFMNKKKTMRIMGSERNEGLCNVHIALEAGDTHLH
jgi:hypothetical protein